MHGTFRWVLMLLVVCVPLKALAASAGFVCLHAHESVSLQMAAQGNEAHEPCDGHEAPAAEGSVGQTHARGVCAPCSVAAAPAPEAVNAVAAVLPPDFAGQAVGLAVGIVTGVPERPPR